MMLKPKMTATPALKAAPIAPIHSVSAVQPTSMKMLIDAGVLLAPSKAANAGGVAVSGLEMSQNSQRYAWTSDEIDQKLQQIMASIHEQCVTYGEEDVKNVNYASTRHSIEELAENAISPALADCAAGQVIHFVTHSLGGILVRQFLHRNRIENLGRVVMLGPPNKGSQVVDKLSDFPGFRFVHGDAGLELGTGATSVPNRLGNANFDLGIIAGTRSINLLLSFMIPGADDGKVSVENTKLEGMRDHLEMEVTHTFMMQNKKVIDQVIHYLQSGKFKRA